MSGMRSHNLPVHLTNFVGREQEIAKLEELLGARLLTLTGAGGSGKTRLAMELAARSTDRFSDGVWFVELAALDDAALISRAIAEAAGVCEEPQRPLVETLIRALEPLHSLLVLDNCEHLVDGCAALTDQLLRACTSLQVLTTSRQPLGVAGETTWRVPSLSLSDTAAAGTDEIGACEAVRLFMDRASASLPSFRLTDRTAQAVAQVCRRLDGMPLAIELAAARLGAMGIEQISIRLDDRFQLLTNGSRTALLRQRTLRAAIDWSHDLLPGPAQVLLRRLAVFAGGWSIEAAEEVCGGDGIPSAGVLGLLMHLVDHSLVVVEEQDNVTWYRLLETLRQYAFGRLVEADEEDSVRARHRDWCLALVERADACGGGPKHVTLDVLEQEQDNLRAASRWCLERGESEIGLRLTVAGSRFCSLQHLVRVAIERGDAQQSANLRAECLHVAERPGARRDVATCLEVQAGFFATTDPARAARLFGAAESLRESLGLAFEQAERETDARGRTLASTALGQVVFRAALAEGRQLPLQAAVELSLAPAECTPSCSSNRSENQLVRCVAARLTTREVEVARLISKGLSNREIADELVIAERTAEAHVTHLLSKLGLRSRAQIAVWAVEQRLAKLHSA
jgi:predicted ATPase/DNA-binding CsgD family transcriptional regulator